MSEMLSKAAKACPEFFRRTLILAVTMTTLAWGVLATAMFAPLTASAAGCTSGTLIKGSLSAVYYCGGDGKRYVFPNEKTYNTWFSDFSGVTSISDADLATIQIGGNVTYRPGVKMVKITTDPTVYAVDANGTLRPIADEATAAALYGSDWNTKIDDVPDAFFTNYTVGSSAAGFDPAAAMSGSQSINEDKGLSGMTSASAGVSLASDNPAGSTVPSSATGVAMLKFVLSNTGSSTMSVDSVTLKRVGPGATTDISAVYLYEGSERLTTGRSVNSSTNEVNFTGLGLDLAPGASRTLWVSVDIASSPGAGNVHAFQVLKAMAGSSELAGTPVAGNNFTLSSATVGSLTITKTGTITNPKVGEKDAKIAEFQVSAGSSEDVSLQRLTLFQGGNLAGVNLVNLKLKQAGNTIATSSGLNSKLRTTFDIVGGFSLEKGQNKTFQVYADIGGSARSGDTLKIYVEEDADIHGVGATFGHGASVTRTGYDGDNCTASTGDCSYSEVEAGQVTVNFLGPLPEDRIAGHNDVELYRFTMVVQSNIEMKQLVMNIAATGDGLIDAGAGGANYTDVKITETNSGSVWWGPLDISTGGSDSSQNLTFTDVQVLTPGQVYDFSVTADLATTIDDGDDVTLTLNAFGTSDLRNLDNSTFLTPSSDVVPSGAQAGNSNNIQTSIISMAFTSTPVSDTHVKGANGIHVLGITGDLAENDEVTLSSLTFTGFVDADGGGDYQQGQDTDGAETTSMTDLLTSCMLLDVATGLQVGTFESPTTSSSNGTGGQLQFTNLDYQITDVGYAFIVVCDLSNSAFRNGDAERFYLQVTAAGDITANRDSDGNSVSALAAFPVNGTPNVIMTTADAGTMSYALAPDDTESEAGIVIAGQSGVVLGKLRLTAQNEELKQTKLRVSLQNAPAFTNMVSMSLYDGATLIAGPVPVDSSGNADFSGFEFVVPKEGSKILTIKATLNSIAAGATSGHDIGISVDLLNAVAGVVEYRGTSSSTVRTSDGAFDFATADISGRQKVVRKTKPTISLASLPTSTLTNGTVTLSRITVTADSAEQVALKHITWSLSKAAGAAFAVSTGSSMREVGQGSNITGSATTTGAGGCGIDGDTVTTCTVKGTFTSEQVIAAGTSKTYELVMTASSVASNDTVTTQINADAASLITGELDDQSGTAGEAIDDFDLDGAGADTAAATAEYNFIWSDNSAIPHNDTSGATEDGEDAAASNDWTNGSYVKVLPTDAQTLLAP